MKQKWLVALLFAVILAAMILLLIVGTRANIEGGIGGWGTLITTMVFTSILVFTAVVIAERYAGVFAPIWIICFLIGMSILFDYGGVRQTEFRLFGITMFFAAGPMLWPVLALGQDYLNEFYGREIAVNYTFGMFAAKIGVALGTLWILLALPKPVTDTSLGETARIFNELMRISPRINIASIIAVVAAFLANAYVFARLRLATKGRHLWLRNIVSSALALTIDGFVFFYGAFAFVLPWNVVFDITIGYLIVSYVTVFIDMGFLYLMVNIKKRNLFGISSRIGQSLNIRTLKAQEE
jgi:hypothetical protein